MRVASVVLAYSDRAGADRLAVVLRELGVAAAVVPEEDERFPGGWPGRCAWRRPTPPTYGASCGRSRARGLSAPEALWCGLTARVVSEYCSGLAVPPVARVPAPVPALRPAVRTRRS